MGFQIDFHLKFPFTSHFDNKTVNSSDVESMQMCFYLIDGFDGWYSMDIFVSDALKDHTFNGAKQKLEP